MNRQNESIMTMALSFQRMLFVGLLALLYLASPEARSEEVGDREADTPMWQAELDVDVMEDEELLQFAELARSALVQVRRERQLHQYHLEQNNDEVRRIYTEIVQLQRQIQSKHAELMAALATDEQYGQFAVEEAALIERIQEVQEEMMERARAERDD